MAQPVYNKIGDNYNQTRVADPYLAKTLYHLLQGNVSGKYLDIGCGTGNYTIAMHEMGLLFTGMDPSEKMLTEAQSRNSEIFWIPGQAEKMPFPDAHFDGAIATLTVHHWKKLTTAFEEIYRVLKPGARLVVFTSTPEQMQGYWLNHYFPEMLQASIAQMPSLEVLESTAALSGLKLVQREIYFVHDDLKDHFLYVGKNHPEKYMDASVRQGISSFSVLALADEVQNGLQQLQQDMQDGSFAQIQASFANNLGDYLFAVFSKPALQT